jgi:hypothetical protein
LEMYRLFDNPPHIRPNGQFMWDESLGMMELSAHSLHRCALILNFQLWQKSSVG